MYNVKKPISTQEVIPFISTRVFISLPELGWTNLCCSWRRCARFISLHLCKDIYSEDSVSHSLAILQGYDSPDNYLKILWLYAIHTHKKRLFPPSFSHIFNSRGWITCFSTVFFGLQKPPLHLKLWPMF